MTQENGTIARFKDLIADSLKESRTFFYTKICECGIDGFKEEILASETADRTALLQFLIKELEKEITFFEALYTKQLRVLAEEIDANNKVKIKIAVQDIKEKISELNDLLSDLNEIFIESFLIKTKSEPLQDKFLPDSEDETISLEKPKIRLKSKNDAVLIFSAMQSAGIIGEETVPDQIAQIFFNDISEIESIKLISQLKTFNSKAKDGSESEKCVLLNRFIIELCQRMNLGELALLQKEISEIIKNSGSGIIIKS